MQETCQRCKESDYDRRTLLMSCLYDMSETGLPFNELIYGDERFYTLRVCKECRAQWMSHILNWFYDVDKLPESCGSGIFIRELGAVREISDDEWQLRNPGIEPVRFKPDPKQQETK